jgi:hypothetical protein
MSREYVYVGSRKHYPQSGGWRYNKTRELLFIRCDDCKAWITDEAYVTKHGELDICPVCDKKRGNRLKRNQSSMSPELFEKILRLREMEYELEQARLEEGR